MLLYNLVRSTVTGLIRDGFTGYLYDVSYKETFATYFFDEMLFFDAENDFLIDSALQYFSSSASDFLV